jgi:chemotaxis protein histidine kinase CheA
VRPKNKQGTIFIKIKDEGSNIYFEVCDDGVGIDEVKIKKLNNQLDHV